jgi:cysteine desulfurase/selenocysteine lyase
MHPAVSNGAYDVDRIRADFPALALKVYGKPLTYLDNAASAQKPQAVLDRLNKAYTEQYANVHRGLHYLANEATEAYEGARETVQKFLNAERKEEIIFTRNATEAINLVAYTFGREHIREGDEIVLSIMEHHSNIVPWHFLRERQGAVIKWAPVDEEGNFLIEEFEKLLGPRTKMVAITQMSNALGTAVPVKEVVRLAHARGIPVLVDGAQGAVHLDVDVRDLDCDFYACTGHKLYGPTGIGVLYGKYAHLAVMPPFNGGGEMIGEVFQDRITYGEPPHRFEAGTPAIVQAIGLAAAIDYVNSIGKARIRAHEDALLKYAHERQRVRQRPDRLLRDQGRASARRRHHHRPRGRGGARRHPLRDAVVGALWPHRHLPRLVCHVQHQGRGGCARRLAGQGTGILRMTDDTPMRDTMTEAAVDTDKSAENAAVTGASALPADELSRLTDDIVAAIKTVYDPEIPADIYELGLIYKIDIGDDRAIKIDMSLTSPNCPSAQELPIMVENAVSSVPGVKEAKVEVVWDPPWDPSRMSDEARLVLNMW